MPNAIKVLCMLLLSIVAIDRCQATPRYPADMVTASVQRGIPFQASRVVVKVTVEEYSGTKINPKYHARFQATVVVAEPLYARDPNPPAEVPDGYRFLVTKTPANTSFTFNGIVAAYLGASGAWENEQVLFGVNLSEALGQSIDQMRRLDSGFKRAVIRGEQSEREYHAMLAEKARSQAAHQALRDQISQHAVGEWYWAKQRIHFFLRSDWKLTWTRYASDEDWLSRRAGVWHSGRWAIDPHTTVILLDTVAPRAVRSRLQFSSVERDRMQFVLVPIFPAGEPTNGEAERVLQEAGAPAAAGSASITVGGNAPPEMPLKLRDANGEFATDCAGARDPMRRCTKQSWLATFRGQKGSLTQFRLVGQNFASLFGQDDPKDVLCDWKGKHYIQLSANPEWIEASLHCVGSAIEVQAVATGQVVFRYGLQ